MDWLMLSLRALVGAWPRCWLVLVFVLVFVLVLVLVVRPGRDPPTPPLATHPRPTRDPPFWP